MKIDSEIVKLAVTSNLDSNSAQKVMEDIQNLLQKQEEEKTPRQTVKKEYVVLTTGEVEGEGCTGWVLQIPEEDSPAVTEQKIIASAREFNQTKKGQKMPVRTIGEACEAVPARFFKEQQVWVKTKTPVYILKANDNNIVAQ